MQTGVRNLVYLRQARDVFFFDVHVKRRAKHASYPTMSRIADLLVIAASDDDFPVKEFENGEMTYIFKEVIKDLNDQTVTILLESSNQNVTNTSYVSHKKRTRRDFDRVGDEGGSHSAHIVISLTPESTGDNVYMCLMEKVPDFSEHRVRSILNTAIRLLCKETDYFVYANVGGSKKKTAFVPYLDFQGHASEALQEDLENGRINSLTLVDPDTDKVLGQGKFFSGVEKNMKVKMIRQPSKGQMLSTIMAVARSQAKDYSRIRISFQPEDGGPSTHVDLDATTGNLVSDGYVKTRHFGGIYPPITTSAVDRVVPHLISRMKHVLLKERS